MKDNYSSEGESSNNSFSEENEDLDQFKLNDTDSQSDENSDQEQEKSEPIWKKFQQSLIDSTDIYYQQNNTNKHAKRTSHHKKWEPPTIQELKYYLGILINIGVIQKPTARMHWKLDENISKTSLKSYMTLERFSTIRSNLHLNHRNNNNKLYDNMKSINIFIENQTKKFYSIFLPSQKLCIDESIIKFKGRTNMKVFMPLKLIRYDLKVFRLADSTCGYILNLQLQEGTKNTLTTLISNLTKNYANKGYMIVFDRFYTSIDFINSLSERGFQAIGACMKNNMRSSKQLQKNQSNQQYLLLYQVFFSNSRNN